MLTFQVCPYLLVNRLAVRALWTRHLRLVTHCMTNRGRWRLRKSRDKKGVLALVDEGQDHAR
jgi:hypothetical protein